MTERFPVAYLFPLRILFGVIMLLEGWGKLQGDWLHGDPLAATLGRWLGVADDRMPDVLPNIGNFGASRYLGFLT